MYHDSHSFIANIILLQLDRLITSFGAGNNSVRCVYTFGPGPLADQNNNMRFRPVCSSVLKSERQSVEPKAVYGAHFFRTRCRLPVHVGVRRLDRDNLSKIFCRLSRKLVRWLFSSPRVCRYLDKVNDIRRMPTKTYVKRYFS